MKLLGHPLVGGSLFHCGWGSMIETLQFGHCLVVLPLIVDQSLNAAVVAARDLAVEVETAGDGPFSKDAVSKALRLAMVDEEGDKYRKTLERRRRCLETTSFIAKFVEFLREGVKSP